jgi:hypothetical protein
MAHGAPGFARADLANPGNEAALVAARQNPWFATRKRSPCRTLGKHPSPARTPVLFTRSPPALNFIVDSHAESQYNELSDS